MLRHIELKHHAAAVLTVTIACLLTLWLSKFVAHPVVTLFFAAIAISARFGGVKPGIVATSLSALLAAYFIFPPLYSLAITDIVQLIEFLVVALVLCFTFGQLRATQRVITRTNKHLEQEVQDRIERERQLRQHSQALSELANHPAIAKGDLNSALNAITEQAASGLDIERVSVWLMNDEHNKLRCVNLYERSQHRHSSGFKREQEAHSTYFQALATSRTIAVADTRTDPRVQEFWATWLAPNHIVSLIGAPIRVGGEIVGMVFHEQVQTPRQWKLLEQTFVGSIADFAALVLEVSERTRLEAERKQAEAALRVSEAEFRALFAAIPDLLFVIDVTGRILRATPIEAEKLYKPLNEQVGHILHQVFEGAQADTFLGYVQHALSTQQTLDVEYSLIMREQETWFASRIAPISPDAVIWIARDISEQRNAALCERKRAETASILEERNRMAREIHDTLAQSFTGIVIQARAAARSLTLDPEKAQASLAQVQNLAQTGLFEARRSVETLRRPYLLEQHDLLNAFKYLATQLESPASAIITCEAVGIPYQLSFEVENNLLRIGQEAITNALKYAQATEIHIELIYQSRQCRLRIKDDGQGFAIERSSSHKKGFGLLGMAERAACIGAQLQIQSTPGQGTEIAVSVNQEQSS